MINQAASCLPAQRGTAVALPLLPFQLFLCRTVANSALIVPSAAGSLFKSQQSSVCCTSVGKVGIAH